MFDKYIDYDNAIKKMVEQHNDNIAALELLEEQYKELMESDGVSALQYDKVKTQQNVFTDEMANRLIRKESVKMRMDELSNECRVFDMAWDHLSEDERNVIEAFFMCGLKSKDAVDFLCERYYYERPTAYRRRDEALGRLKRLLFGQAS